MLSKNILTFELPFNENFFPKIAKLNEFTLQNPNLKSFSSCSKSYKKKLEKNKKMEMYDEMSEYVEMIYKKVKGNEEKETN